MIRNTIRSLITATWLATLVTNGICQQPATRPQNVDVSRRIHVASRMPTDMLAQVSDSLRQLASKVSPAVVQIEVTGFRPAEQGPRKGSDASVLVRERTVGTGV